MASFTITLSFLTMIALGLLTCWSRARRFGLAVGLVFVTGVCLTTLVGFVCSLVEPRVDDVALAVAEAAVRQLRGYIPDSGETGCTTSGWFDYTAFSMLFTVHLLFAILTHRSLQKTLAEEEQAFQIVGMCCFSLLCASNT